MAPASEIVRQGEPLIRFDSSTAEQQLIENQTALEQAQATLEQAIADGRITLAAIRAGASDAACCPGELVRWTYRLAADAGGLVLDQEQVEGRLTPDLLSGTQWGLSAWDLEEPVAEPLVITLSYADGQFFGMSACNRYAAGVASGRAPGDIEVGPARGTRMACPEPAMSAETRFLEQLAATRKFGFRLGRLALTYERESGIGLMLLERAEIGRAHV